MKQFLLLSSIFFCVLLSAGCSKNKSDEPKSPVTVGRTVLVYMVANNDLGKESYDYSDISEMRKGAAMGALGNNSRLLVMHQAPTGKRVLKEITPKGNVDTLKIYDSESSPLSVDVMRGVFDDMREYAPALAYGLVMWSHGNGWTQDETLSDTSKAPIKRAYGLDGNLLMPITRLAEALEGQNFEYIYFDCCFMASVEIAYELRHSTKLIAGSATELPKPGMPYDENLQMLMQGRVADAAANTFSYYDNLSGSMRTCTMSVINTEALDELAEAVKKVYSTSVPLESGIVPQAFERSNRCRHFDLLHYAELIATDQEALEAMKESLNKAVIFAGATPYIFNSLTLFRHCGLSTNIIRSQSDYTARGYNELQWAKEVASTLPSNI